MQSTAASQMPSLARSRSERHRCDRAGRRKSLRAAKPGLLVYVGAWEAKRPLIATTELPFFYQRFRRAYWLANTLR